MSSIGASEAIRSLANKPSARIDQIPSYVIRGMYNIIAEPLTIIFNTALMSGVSP